MRKSSLFCVVLASLFVFAVPGNAAAAEPIAHFHERFSDTFPTEMCGIGGTSVIEGVENVTRFSDGTFIITGAFTETFTATTSQNSIVIHAANQFTRRSLPVDNGDGTLTFTVTFNGLHEQIRIANGPVLSFDAGTITLANTFRDNGDGTFTFVSTTIVELHGLHPESLSDGTLFCDVVVPALT
jgi:hypothetical protein